MAGAAGALLGAVSGEQRAVLHSGLADFGLESPRRKWTYLPEVERPGLPLRGLTDEQRKLAHQLITASVSIEGYAKVVSIMAMEHVRRALTLLSRPDAAQLFDPERYCFRIFGEPGGPEPVVRLGGVHRPRRATLLPRSGTNGIPNGCLVPLEAPGEALAR
jgi:hypothetical protein